MQFSQIKEQQKFRDSYSGDIFIKVNATSAHTVKIGGFVGDLHIFKPSDRVDPTITGS
jgi:hypothetical protein